MGFEAYPEFYHRSHGILKLESQFIQQRISEIGESPASIKILDLACGTGRLSNLFGTVDHLISSDKNFLMLKFRQKLKCDNEALFQADNLQLPMKSNCFDMILLSMNSVAYFSPDEVLVLMKEVNRVLKDGGIFIFDQLDPRRLSIDDEFVKLIGCDCFTAYERIDQKQIDGWQKVTRKYCSNDGNTYDIQEWLYFHKLNDLRKSANTAGFKTCVVWDGFGKSRVHRKSSRWVFEIRS